MSLYAVKWEIDGEKVGDLPAEVFVPDDLEVDEVADFLSDEYGWLVDSLSLINE
jgi:hypothetical protein